MTIGIENRYLIVNSRKKTSKGGVTDQWVRANVKCLRLDMYFFTACYVAQARHGIPEAIVEQFFSIK
ncbi:MAG: hypothetical protein OXH31_00755 [Gammaproteobacteria bacterium]|nr:hypothetical protein [Gammaproteobacteria bacterium]